MIELDDASHQARDRRERDVLADAVYRSAGLPILHIPAAWSYGRREVSSLIQERLRPTKWLPIYFTLQYFAV